MSSPQLKDIKKPHLFAHRGGNEAGPKLENTKIAFSSSASLGYKFLETDVILTRDGQVICYHGAQNWLTKYNSGLELRRHLQGMTYAQIKNKKFLGNEPVPKLEDILKSFPKCYFSIDAKTEEVAEPLVKLLKKLKVEDRVIITSFNLKRTLRANKAFRGTDIQASLCLGLVPGLLINIMPSLILNLLKSKGIAYLQVPYRLTTARIIKKAKQQGIYIYAWTVNDAKNMVRLLTLDIDGIMSDEAKLLLKTAKKQKA